MLNLWCTEITWNYATIQIIPNKNKNNYEKKQFWRWRFTKYNIYLYYKSQKVFATFFRITINYFIIITQLIRSKKYCVIKTTLKYTIPSKRYSRTCMYLSKYNPPLFESTKQPMMTYLFLLFCQVQHNKQRIKA